MTDRQTTDKQSAKEIFLEQTRYVKAAASKERNQQRGRQHQGNNSETVSKGNQ